MPLYSVSPPDEPRGSAAARVPPATAPAVARNSLRFMGNLLVLRRRALWSERIGWQGLGVVTRNEGDQVPGSSGEENGLLVCRPRPPKIVKIHTNGWLT